MIKYRFIPQIGIKPKVKAIGLLCIDNGKALFFENEAGWNDKLLGILEHPEIKWMNSNGIYLKGFAPNGTDKLGRNKYKYMEWYCTFITDDHKEKKNENKT
jgi:hypothetical protein